MSFEHEIFQKNCEITTEKKMDATSKNDSVTMYLACSGIGLLGDHFVGDTTPYFIYLLWFMAWHVPFKSGIFNEIFKCET